MNGLRRGRSMKLFWVIEFSEMTFTPHDQITPGFWYLRTVYEPGYTVVSVTLMVLGHDKGTLGVFVIDQEGKFDLADFDSDQFICPVPPPAF